MTRRPTNPLVDHCDAIIEKLRELAPTAMGAAEAEAIHQARVATRRMRAVLRLIRPLISDEQRKPLSKALRKLRRRLGDARDRDVMMGHLQSLGKARSSVNAVNWLTMRLSEQRRAAEKEIEPDSAGRTLSKLGAWWGIREEMLLKADRLDQLLGASLHQQLDVFTAKSDRLSKATGEPCDPHELRIAGKSLRYTLEMAQAAGHPIGKPTLKTFKRLQDALGLWHDYVVLAERAMSESSDAMLAHHDLALQSELLRLVQRLLKRAESQLKKFAALWQAHGPEVQREIHAAFPRITIGIEAITPPQMGRDPAGSDESAGRGAFRQDDPATA